MKKQILSCLFIALLLTSTVSCGNTEVDTQATETETKIQEVTEETGISLGIPEEDNGGRNFHILVPTEKAYEFAEEATGEAVNDAIFNRCAATEEHFNIQFTYQQESGDWDVRNTYNSFIGNAVLAGDSVYDLVTGYIVCTLPIFQNGYLLDLTTVSDLNLDNAWWMVDQYEDLNINEKMFCCYGDGNLSVYKDCAVVYFNKQVLQDFNLEEPYDLVRNNQWTMDKFMEMSEFAVVDLDGDGKIDPKVDAVGAYTQHVPLRAFQTAMEVRICTKDAETGALRVTELTDKLLQAQEYVRTMQESDAFFVSGEAQDFQAFAEQLASDHALFHLSYLYVLEGDVMRNMESDFGIVPYPKYDAMQESYKTQIGTSSNVNFLMKTCADPNLSGRVLEVLAYYGMQDVIPTYYTVALENKYTRDSDVQEMLALIRAGMTMNFDFAFSTCFTPFTNTVLQESKDNLASYMAAKEKSWNAQFEELYAAALDG